MSSDESLELAHQANEQLDTLYTETVALSDLEEVEPDRFDPRQEDNASEPPENYEGHYMNHN